MDTDARPKLYVCGPMSGLPEFNYPAFHAAKAALLEAGYGVHSPADHELVEVIVWADYMRKDIPLLLDCDAVAVLEGWENSRGATLECHIAAELDMSIQTVEQWLAAARTVA